MIHTHALTKRFGDTIAVEDLTFQLEPGRVTGFLGPNGAGKTTTIGMILGLVHPTRGTATIGGRPYTELTRPLFDVGVVLNASAVQGGRKAKDHLRWLAASNGIPSRRSDDVLSLVGLERVADRRIRTFSLGMRQRLGLAAAMLGDPGVLILDEPANGLDVEGIRWIRELLRSLADEGRTILVSSHDLSEMELIAHDVLVIGRGRLMADGPVDKILAGVGNDETYVRTPDRRSFRTLLRSAGAHIDSDASGRWTVSGVDTPTIGRLAAENGVRLHELTSRRSSLEEVYTELVDEQVEYRATGQQMPTGQGG